MLEQRTPTEDPATTAETEPESDTTAPDRPTGDGNNEDGHDDGSDRGTAAPAPTDETDVGDARSRSIAKDDAFHLLQNSRRRAVLRYLLARPEREQFRMRDLAEEIAAWEHDTTVRQLSSDERQRVYIALYQSHLPKLDDHGLIEYNQPRGFVEPTRLVSVCEPFLEEGLDADTQELHLADGVDTSPDDAGQSPTLSHAVSSLLTR